MEIALMVFLGVLIVFVLICILLTLYHIEVIIIEKFYGGKDNKK